MDFNLKSLNSKNLILIFIVPISIYLIATILLLYLFPIISVPCSDCNFPKGSLGSCLCVPAFSDSLNSLSFLRYVIPIVISFIFCFVSLKPNLTNSLVLFLYLLVLYSVFYIFLPYFFILFNW